MGVRFPNFRPVVQVLYCNMQPSQALMVLSSKRHKHFVAFPRAVTSRLKNCSLDIECEKISKISAYPFLGTTMEFLLRELTKYCLSSWVE